MAFTGKKLSLVTGYLTDYIQKNALTKGQRLPTETELIEAIGVSRVTLRRALANMQEENLIYSVQGSGYFVGDHFFPRENHVIPIIISYDHENSKILNIVHGAQNYLKARSCELEVHVSRRDPKAEKEMLLQLYEQGCRCAIIFPVSSEDNSDLYFHLLQNGMQLIFIDRRPADISCCHLVMSDNMTGGYLATRHLLELGHRRIATFGLEPMAHTSTIQERVLGYRHALREFGVPEPEKSYFFSAYKRQNRDVEEIFDPANGFTAVFAINDHAAVDIATHAYRYGLRVPEDLSVIGFDNLDITTVFTPHLSTIDQPFTQLGESAAEIAFQCLTGNVTGYIQKSLPIRLIPRDSTRKR